MKRHNDTRCNVPYSNLFSYFNATFFSSRCVTIIVFTFDKLIILNISYFLKFSQLARVISGPFANIVFLTNLALRIIKPIKRVVIETTGVCDVTLRLLPYTLIKLSIHRSIFPKRSGRSHWCL